MGKRGRAVHRHNTASVMSYALFNRTHNTTSAPDSAYKTDISGKQLQQSAPLDKQLRPTNPILVQCWLRYPCGTRVIWSQYAVYNCWRDGTYKKSQISAWWTYYYWKFKSQLLQPPMSSQLSFKLLQLKAILCYSTLKNDMIRSSKHPTHSLQSTQCM